MFTGIIEEIGKVISLQSGAGKIKARVQGDKVLQGTQIGDSIAIEGVCQTVIHMDGGSFEVEILKGSQEKTTLGQLRTGQKVNLERALSLGDRLGGHMVQGHVNKTVAVSGIQQDRDNVFLTLEMNPQDLRYCIDEGSVTLNGVSLTIYKKTERSIEVNIIPHTWSQTTLQDLKVGSPVNLEVDLIARHLEALGGPWFSSKGLSMDQLKTWGYA